jgi:4-hydroxy-4-methyl-2-oxoglutarate aldolase
LTPEDWTTLGAATLGESGARRMHPRIKPVWPGARVAGPVLTVRCAPGDNLAIHAAVAAAETPGAVVVVDAAAVPALGYWGEVLTAGAEARGIAGLVIDGGVRDVDALQAHGFAVFSALVALPGATKVAGGAYGIGVRVGDVDVEPGDWVVGDRDGVVVVPRDALDAVLAAGRARATKEAQMFADLRAGATTVDLLGLDVTQLDAS